MSDYAGACVAIKARFVAAWTETPIAFANQDPPQEPWPPASGAWVYAEVVGNGSDLRSIGKPGDHMWTYRGHIFIHVFVPIGYGVEEPERLAVAAGEIFRAATFYDDGNGSKVVCISPQVDGGASDADEGNWFRVTATVPFNYLHRG
jgi:hypothetical protein